MYEEISVESILNRMLDNVSNKLDKREGSVIWDALSPAANEIMALYIQLERIIKEGFGDTASREFLILRCRERGISPYPAEKSVAKGVFTPQSIDVTGKRFSIGEVNFIVTEKIGGGEYRMECETAGKIGNRSFGDMIPIEYIEGLERAELTEILIPGEDQEETEDLRKRYFESFEEKAFGGNVRDYKIKTAEIAGVGGVKVKCCFNGDINPSSFVPSSKTDSFVHSALSSSSVDDEVKNWLSAVYKAAKEEKLTAGGTVLLTVIDSDYNPPSKELIDRVKKAADPLEYSGEGMGFAPIGHRVKVEGGEGVSVNITTKISFENGYNIANLKDSIEKAVNDYLLELRKDWADNEALTVRKSQIETRLLSIKGISDVSQTSVNGKEENLSLKENQVPVLNSVKVKEEA